MKRRTRILNKLLLMPLVLLAASGAGAFAKVSTTMTQFTTVDPNKSPWAFSLSASGERGLGYQQDSWDLVTGASVIRNFKDGSLASVGMGYRSILYREYSGEVFDRYDAQPELYGPTDLGMSYIIPGAYEAEPFTLTPSFKLGLPTSTVSRDASMIAALDSDLSLDTAITDWFSVTPSIGASLRQYRYDDANEAGTKVNSPFALNYGLTVAAIPVEKLILSASYGQTQRYNYQGVWTLIQTATAALQYKITNRIEAVAGYGWKDKILTNEAAFAYDRSSFTLGLKATVQ